MLCSHGSVSPSRPEPFGDWMLICSSSHARIGHRRAEAGLSRDVVRATHYENLSGAANSMQTPERTPKLSILLENMN